MIFNNVLLIFPHHYLLYRIILFRFIFLSVIKIFSSIFPKDKWWVLNSTSVFENVCVLSWIKWSIELWIYRCGRLQKGPNSLLFPIPMVWFWTWVTWVALANRMLENIIKAEYWKALVLLVLCSAIAWDKLIPLIPYKAILG